MNSGSTICEIRKKPSNWHWQAGYWSTISCHIDIWPDYRNLISLQKKFKINCWMIILRKLSHRYRFFFFFFFFFCILARHVIDTITDKLSYEMEMFAISFRVLSRLFISRDTLHFQTDHFKTLVWLVWEWPVPHDGENSGSKKLDILRYSRRNDFDDSVTSHIEISAELFRRP